jgi:hypothetical protein
MDLVGSHIPYIFSIIFITNNNVDIFIFYLIFIMTTYNIKYITKLLICLTYYKNNIDLFKLMLLSNIVSEKYLSFACGFYYFYNNLIDSKYFYLKAICLYIALGSNINIWVVYNIHFRMFMKSSISKEISLRHYMAFVDFTKNVFICIFIMY